MGPCCGPLAAVFSDAMPLGSASLPEVSPLGVSVRCSPRGQASGLLGYTQLLCIAIVPMKAVSERRFVSYLRLATRFPYVSWYFLHRSASVCMTFHG